MTSRNSPPSLEGLGRQANEGWGEGSIPSSPCVLDPSLQPSSALPPKPATEGGGSLHPQRYLLVVAAAAALAFGAVWLFVAAAPLAFLDPEYPYWLAKQELLQRCDIGTVLVVGDSRAAVDIIPARLGVKTTNLAVGGGEAIEAYAALRHALACPDPPRRVVISFDAAHFVRPDLFWDRSVRFGALDFAELADLRAVSERLGDVSILDQKHADGLPRGIRAFLYAARFPGLYFNSVLKGGVVLRWRDNHAALRAGLASRGQYYFGTAPGSSVVAIDGHVDHFAALPVLDAYFNRLLALLASRHIQADFVAMPLNDSTRRAVNPALLEGFSAYLAGYAARYPNFHILGPLMPSWDDAWFGDGFAHLNPVGAVRFSEGFGTCLRARLAATPGEVSRDAAAAAPGEAAAAAAQVDCAAFDQPPLHDAPPSTQNAAQWGWFSATGRDASANVAPISKRGS